jgi:hypothetical protein
MVKSADTADLKSADHKRSWGFKSPSGHHQPFPPLYITVVLIHGSFVDFITAHPSNVRYVSDPGPFSSSSAVRTEFEVKFMFWLNADSVHTRLSVLIFALVAILCLGPACSRAQTSSAKTTPAESASSGVGFSIETEMLTYRALESNGEAIACDVAGYLHNATVSFKDAAPGAICNVTSTGGGSKSGVMILPFDRSVFADFQIWRSDMETMNEFERRGAGACSTKPDEDSARPGASTRGLTSGAATAATTAAKVGGVMGALTPAGAMLSTASGVLGLFASDHSSSPVSGTIQDQAFMDDVSRELRSIDVPVMMPSVYSPYALTSIDPSRSPFLIALDKLLRTRDCLMADKPKYEADVKNIDAFLAALSTTTSTAKSTAPQSGASAAATAQSTTNASSTSTPAGATQPSTSGPSHLEAVLAADGLAMRLGANPDNGQIPDNAPHHVLLIKALESGGSVSRSSSIFGTNISYSGGSVGTYALFALNGELECAGNVYDYAGFVSAKKFQKELRDYKPDPGNQVVFIRGGCRAR